MSLEKAVSASGFDTKSIGTLAKVADSGSRHPPPPPSSIQKQSTEEITSKVDYLTELMEEKLTANNGSKLSDADKKSTLAKSLSSLILNKERRLLILTLKTYRPTILL